MSVDPPEAGRVSRIERVLSLRTLTELCAEIETLSPGFTGEIRLGRALEMPLGIVFVERRRVCWAAARGLSRRLSDLIATRARLDRAAIEAHYRRCKDEGIPLGEHLVSRGLLDADALRTALLQHTVESLEHVLVESTSTTFITRRGGYAPRFTFSTAELMASSGRDEKAAREVEAHFGGLGWGAAFLRGETSTPRLAAVTGDHPEDASALVRLGRWGAAVLDLADAVHTGRALVMASRRGRTVVAVESGGFVLVGEVGEHGAGRVLNRRASRLHGRI